MFRERALEIELSGSNGKGKEGEGSGVGPSGIPSIYSLLIMIPGYWISGVELIFVPLCRD